MSLHYQYADMHCDTLLHGLGKGVNDIYDMPDAMLDLKRMAEANVLCQFFAVFFPPRPEMLTPQEREKRLKAGRPEMPPDEELFSNAVRLMQDSFAAHKDVIRQAYCFDDVMKNKEQGLISGVLTVEDGRMVNGSFDRLEKASAAYQTACSIMRDHQYHIPDYSPSLALDFSKFIILINY